MLLYIKPNQFFSFRQTAFIAGADFGFGLNFRQSPGAVFNGLLNVFIGYIQFFINDSGAFRLHSGFLLGPPKIIVNGRFQSLVAQNAAVDFPVRQAG